MDDSQSACAVIQTGRYERSTYPLTSPQLRVEVDNQPGQTFRVKLLTVASTQLIYFGKAREVDCIS